MSSEKTILPAAVLVSLYKDTLVLTETAAQILDKEEKKAHALVGETVLATAPINEKVNEQKVVDATTPLKYLGDHLKKVIVIVNDPTAVYLNEADLGLLSSILNACKLTLADIALINIATQSIGLHDMLETLPSTLVISFDVNATQLKIKLPATLYKPIVLGDTHVLFSNSLSNMQGGDVNAKTEKGKLWIVLKQLFQL